MKTVVSILAAAALLALGGCHRHHNPGTKHVAMTPAGIIVSQARLVLPAVKGHPGAAYFTLANEDHSAVTLVGVDVVGALKAEMHETVGDEMRPLPRVDVAPGQRVIFAPGGKHVMVFNIVTTLTPGGSSEIALHFGDGKTTLAPIAIEPAGDGGGEMAAMKAGGA